VNLDFKFKKTTEAIELGDKIFLQAFIENLLKIYFSFEKDFWPFICLKFRIINA
jgi:hypothetical protein